MINCINVVKVYGKQVALDNVTLEIKDGDFVAIMGPSGSGKSTLLNLMAGIDNVSHGQVLFNNRDYSNLKNKEVESLRQLDMGFIFQEYHILNSLSVFENIALPLTIQKIKKDEIASRVRMIADELEISALLEKFPYQLSGGEKQRVSIARALIINPKTVFADEPTGALDSKNAHRLLRSLQAQNQNKNITTVMVTHDPFSASFSNKVIFIKDGKIYHSLEKGQVSRKDFYEQIIKVSMLLGGEFDAI